MNEIFRIAGYYVLALTCRFFKEILVFLGDCFSRTLYITAVVLHNACISKYHALYVLLTNSRRPIGFCTFATHHCERRITPLRRVKIVHDRHVNSTL